MQNVRNLDYIRSKDPRLFEAITDIVRAQQAITQQVNGSGSGNPLPPPAVNAVKVTGQNGFFHVAVKDEGHIFRGVRYFAEYADNPNFVDPQIVPMGEARNATLYLGARTFYWRAFSSYGSSPAGPPAYHGTAAMPQPVFGGGTNAGPALLASEGSGTGDPGQGLSGPGPIPFRSLDGAPPTRGSVGGATGSETTGEPRSIERRPGLRM